MAEDYCAGVPLTQALPAGGFAYGMPLTTDSLLGVAEAHFKLALTEAHSNDTVTALASVGLGRALMDRNRYDSAALAVATVPTSFVYNVVGETNGNNQYSPTFYEGSLPSAYNNCGGTSCNFNVADGEGGNGLNFISALDPRLVLNPGIEETYDGSGHGASDSIFYYPMKFGYPAAPYIPLATGVEAALIQAEAVLQAGNATQWATDLNNLRAAAPATYLQLSAPVPVMTPDSMNATGSAAVQIMFRERAFWLYGTGTRLGDMRRLIRQYGTDGFTASNVYPVGPWPDANDPTFGSYVEGLLAPLAQYGTDVVMTLPTPASGYTTSNPNYRGCTSPTSQA